MTNEPKDNVLKFIVSNLADTIEKRIAKVQAGEAKESDLFMPWEKLWESGATWPTKALKVEPGKGLQQYAFGNGFMLNFHAMIHGFSDVRYIGLATAKKNGGVPKFTEERKGDHGSMIWMPIMTSFWGNDKASGEKVRISYPKSFKYVIVYNVEQFSWANGMPKNMVAIEERDLPNDKIEAAENFVAKRSPKTINSVKACYTPRTDTIGIPGIRTFTSSESYYSVLFHEIGHWTGADDRMDRAGINKLANGGKKTYSYEELVAEFFQAIVCHHLGIKFERQEENTITYLRGWLKGLQDDPTMLRKAATEAEKAFKWYLGEIKSKSEKEAENEALRQVA